MRKIMLEADEKFVIALFEADNRQRTVEAIEEALPFIKDDDDTYAVAVHSIEKLKQMGDIQFRKLDLKTFLQEAAEIE